MMTMNMNMNGVDQGMMDYGMMEQQTTKVAVSVKNMTCNYRLTVDDLTTVFSRFGKLANVSVGAVDASAATIEFVDFQSAIKCVDSLNGKVLSGEKGTLVVSLLEEPHQQQMMQQQPPQQPMTPPMMQQQPMMHMQQQVDPMNQNFGFNTPPPQMYPPQPQPMMHMQQPQFPQQQNMLPRFNEFPQQQMGMPMHDQFAQQPMQPDYMGGVQHSRLSQMQMGHGHFMAQNEEMHEPPKQRRVRKQNSGGCDNSPSRVRKFTCRFDVGIQNEKTFQVARRIIGSKGANMKKIFKDTGAKLRLRGQGSGFLEGTSQQESPEALHLCISAKKIDEYQMAVRKVEELLQGVYREYRAHCKQKDLATPNLRVVCREHPLVTMHRNAMKAKAEKEGKNALPAIDEKMIVPDATQAIDTSCHNTPQASPGASPPISRQNSSDSLSQMVKHAEATGSDREVELLKELLKLRSANNSRAPSVKGDDNTAEDPAAAIA
jgi:RNA recognition motif-containing protein